MRVFAALLGIALSASTASLAAQPDWKIRTIQLGDTVDEVRAKIDALNRTLPPGMDEGFKVVEWPMQLPDGQNVLAGVVAVREVMSNVREVIQVRFDPWSQQSYSVGRIAIFKSAAVVDTTSEHYQIQGTVEDLTRTWGGHFVGLTKADGSGVRSWFYDGNKGEPLLKSTVESEKLVQRCRPSAKAPVVPPSLHELKEWPFSEPRTVDPTCGRLVSVNIDGISSNPGFIRLMTVQLVDFVAMSEFGGKVRKLQDKVNDQYRKEVQSAPIPPQ